MWERKESAHENAVLSALATSKHKILKASKQTIFKVHAQSLGRLNSMAPQQNKLPEICSVNAIRDDIPNEEVSSTLPGRIKNELREQSKTSLPAVMSMIFLRIPLLITLHMIGNIPSDSDDDNSDQLAAAGLAQSLANLTGLSVAAGLSTALSTLAGQAHGIDHRKKVNCDHKVGNESLLLNSGDINKESKTPWVLPSFSQSATTYLIRAIFVQFAFVIPIGLSWIIGVRPMLVYFGQDETVASLAEDYLRILAPGMWGYSLNFTICTFFQVIGLADIQTYVMIIAAVLHWPLNYMFIYGLDSGFKGAALAMTVSQLMTPSLAIGYALGTRSGRARLPLSTKYEGRTNDMIRYAIYSPSGIRQYLGLALSGLLTMAEWWASETAIFLSGRLKPDSSLALDGMVIYHTTLGVCYLVNFGLSVGASARVGNLLGASKPKEAALASSVAIWMTAIASVAMGAILWFSPHTFFPSFYDPDKAVQMSAARTIPWISLYVIADGIQTTLYGVIKGCGRQPIVVPIVIVSYWCIALPLANHFAFVKYDGTTECDDEFDSEFSTCGIAGLSAGMTVGTYLHCFAIAVAVLCFTDWNKEAVKAAQRFQSSCNGLRTSQIYPNTTDAKDAGGYVVKIVRSKNNSLPSSLTSSFSVSSEEGSCLSSSIVNYGSTDE
mmetsp:Transcript_5411/g.7936  ORF Transcript_5411/g.7936 Transcript_5411/m.7936 type:complete len:665 (-) Transcript_5411:42-2036(-)|eukprot:CAMPEP_0116017186 /NCGR_PEP_ID=MMETSP0321-20121206/7904_1 /TAXON_ID=163516 /ORGANISM="Leptocylindrus danicus var. danicus, Strain B650" /LENGTH=664 /DNA_ID=CAMNT_0003487343 /DNA_START=264 /DNA_END=2258 /DNA_ORIENTATION=-